MFRTFLVLLFLAASGVYFHNTSSDSTAPAPATTTKKTQTVDDSALQALKAVLPSSLFEKDVQPVIEQNRKEGLSADQLSQLMAKLEVMSRTLTGKAAEAVNKTIGDMNLTAQPKSADLSKTASAVSSLAKNVGEGLKENLPAAKEIAGDILHSMVTVLSQLLNAAAELLRK